MRETACSVAVMQRRSGADTLSRRRRASVDRANSKRNPAASAEMPELQVDALLRTGLVRTRPGSTSTGLRGGPLGAQTPLDDRGHHIDADGTPEPVCHGVLHAAAEGLPRDIALSRSRRTGLRYRSVECFLFRLNRMHATGIAGSRGVSPRRHVPFGRINASTATAPWPFGSTTNGLMSMLSMVSALATAIRDSRTSARASASVSDAG